MGMMSGIGAVSSLPTVAPRSPHRESKGSRDRHQRRWSWSLPLVSPEEGQAPSSPGKHALTEEGTMATIVRYRDHERSTNDFPKKIISPSRQSLCCFSHMEEIGGTQREGRWPYQYRRCRTCGFTVRFILPEIPDAELLQEVRDILATALVRNVPDY